MELLLWRRLLLHYIVSLKGTANGAKRDQERSVSRYPQQNLKMPNRMGWLRWLPGLIALREYQASWLMHDIAAGGVLATMLVPVGIAYAVALPPPRAQECADFCLQGTRLQQGFTTGGMGSDRHFAWQQYSGSNVRFGSLADIEAPPIHVRFTPITVRVR